MERGQRSGMGVVVKHVKDVCVGQVMKGFELRNLNWMH